MGKNKNLTFYNTFWALWETNKVYIKTVLTFLHTTWDLSTYHRLGNFAIDSGVLNVLVPAYPQIKIVPLWVPPNQNYMPFTLGTCISYRKFWTYRKSRKFVSLSENYHNFEINIFWKNRFKIRNCFGDISKPFWNLKQFRNKFFPKLWSNYPSYFSNSVLLNIYFELNLILFQIFLSQLLAHFVKQIIYYLFFVSMFNI